MIRRLLQLAGIFCAAVVHRRLHPDDDVLRRHGERGQACGLVRMRSCRTGQVVGYQRADGSRTGSRPDGHEDEPAAREQRSAETNELPSVALTTRFLALCQQYGSERLAVSIVVAGRSTGVPGLPQGNDWTAWNAAEMRAAVEHLQHKLGR